MTRARPPATIGSIEALETWERSDDRAPVLVTVFEPAVRREFVTRLERAGAEFASLLPTGNLVAPEVTYGPGVVAYDPIVLLPNCEIGRFVLLQCEASIAHDITLGDFVSVGAKASVSGNVTIGAGTIVGARAVVVNGSADKRLQIGANVRIAEDAVVTKDVPDGFTVAGNPARRRRN